MRMVNKSELEGVFVVIQSLFRPDIDIDIELKF